MSWIEAIKGPKTLTLKHWRYRLLHWCFNIKPERPSESPLPQFMYTHYCPLFHVTNLIALFAPVIAVIRVTSFLLSLAWSAVMAVVIPFGHACSALWRALVVNLPKRKPKEEQEQKPMTDYQMRKFDHELICKKIQEGWTSFDQFWSRCGYKFMVLKEDEVKELHAQYVVQIREERERREQRERARRELFAKMAIFGQFLFKCIFFALYAAMIVGLVAAVYYGVPLLWSLVVAIAAWMGDSWTWFVAWASDFFTLEVVTTILAWTGGILASAAVITVVVLACFKIQLGTAIGNGVIATENAFAPYFAYCGHMIAAPFVGCYKLGKGFCEFVALFYEDNCPPITIVEDK